MVYHPKLAKELYPGKQFQFYTPDEDNAVRFILPEGYDKETWAHWMRVVKAMANPEKYIPKTLLKESDYVLKNYGSFKQ